jgi:hypothetical protein
MMRLQVLPVGIMRNRGGFQRAARVKRPPVICIPDLVARMDRSPRSPDGIRGEAAPSLFSMLPRIPGLRPSSGLRTPMPAFVARMKRSEIRGKSPWAAPRRKSPWVAIRHKHRRRFSQYHPGFPACGLHPGYEPRCRPCSPDEAKRNPGEVTLGGAPKEVTLGGNQA